MGEKVIAFKEDETRLRIRFESEYAARECQRYFSFEPPGMKFSKKYKAAGGAWDGRVSLYNMHTGLIPYGLLPYVEKFCSDNKHELELDFDLNYQNITLDQTIEFMDSLNMHTKGEALETRDYQIEAVNYCTVMNRGLVLSPTSSGKSSIIYTLIRWYLTQGKRVLLIVPNTSLVVQMYGDFKDYSSENGWDAEENCNQIYYDTDRDYTKPVQISTWQSLAKIEDKKFFEQFDVVIGDEAHQYAAKIVTGILKSCKNAFARFGTTGTMKHGAKQTAKQLHSLQVQGHFGAIYRTISTREMIEQGYAVELDYAAYLLKYSVEDKKDVPETYFEEMEWIVGNKKRNTFIAKLAKKNTGNQLILFQFVEKHGIPLYEGLKKYLKDKHVVYVSGKTSIKERERVKQLFYERDDVVAVCSYGTFSTGINCPNIRHIIFASPFKDRIRLFQSIGRGLRKYLGKWKIFLHDIGDDLRTKKGPNHTLRHMMERISNLEDENLEFSLHKIFMD
jgi:superfamily II DNA or RNA helicase